MAAFAAYCQSYARWKEAQIKSLRMRWRHCLGVILNGKGNKTKGLSEA